MAVNFINFDTKHAVCGSSLLKATHAGHIKNMKVADATLDNGTVVTLGALETGTIEVYKQGAGSTTFRAFVESQASNGNYYVKVTAVAGDYLVLQDPLIYEQHTTQMQHQSNFFNQKDDIVRTYELYVDDVFELSKEGFTGEIAVGDTVQVDSSTKKLKKVAG